MSNAYFLLKCLEIFVRNPEITKEKAVISFSYRYDKPPLKGVKTPKQTQILKDNNPYECYSLWLVVVSNHLYH